MRVLLLGAAGKLGSRILPALIQRGHTVTAFVRDPSKLPSGISKDHFSYEQGDATKATDIKAAATKHECDAIVNAAGVAAVAPWGHSNLPIIIDAVIRATLELGRERGKPLRLWVTAGMGLLDLPTKSYMLVDYLYLLAEHRLTLAKLQALPQESALWSILCPSMMYPLGQPTYPVIEGASVDKLFVSGGVAPQWSDKFMWLPVFGPYLNILSQVAGYKTALEHNADLIASDLLRGDDSPLIYQKVGTKEK